VSFSQRLQKVIRKQRSRLVIGLDSDISKIPRFLLDRKNPLLEFNRLIIEATHDLVCGYKPNFAFYESEGVSGWEALKETSRLIPENLVSIADAKRGDISNTAAAYARAIFEDLDFDAVTLNPYMGYDVIVPFQQYPGRGLLILALTSNSGAADFQMGTDGGTPLFERVLTRIVRWNDKGDLGAVVGATHPEQLTRVREIAPELPLLIPGIGSQGGDLQQTLHRAAIKPSAPVMINVSRGIIFSGDGPHFQDDVRRTAMAFRDRIEQAAGEKHDS